jgi:hypothetical protein
MTELYSTYRSHILESSLIRAAFVKVLVWNRRPPGRLQVVPSKRTLATQVKFTGLRNELGFATAQVFSSPVNNKLNVANSCRVRGIVRSMYLRTTLK